MKEDEGFAILFYFRFTRSLFWRFESPVSCASSSSRTLRSSRNSICLFKDLCSGSASAVSLALRAVGNHNESRALGSIAMRCDVNLAAARDHGWYLAAES